VFKGRTDPVRAVGVVPRGLPRRRRRRTACQGCWGLSPSWWHGPDWIGSLFVQRPPGLSPRRWAGAELEPWLSTPQRRLTRGPGAEPRKCVRLAGRVVGIEVFPVPLLRCNSEDPADGVGLGQPSVNSDKLLKPASRGPSAGSSTVSLDYYYYVVFATLYFSVPGYPFQNRHHGRAGAALRAVWANNLCSSPICRSFAANCSLRISTRSLPVESSAAAGGLWPFFCKGSTSTSHRYPCGVSCLVPLINPLATRRLIVCVDTCKAAAASSIETCMITSLTGWLIRRVPGGYAVFTRLSTLGDVRG